MQGLPGAQDQAVVAGVDPRLDVFLHGSTTVNAARAEQCGSVATAAPAARPAAGDGGRPGWAPPARAEPGEPPPIRLLAAAEVASIHRARRAERDARRQADAGGDGAGRLGGPDGEGLDVDFSVFVEVDRDLDADRRAEVRRQVEALSRRRRWKGDTATVEVQGDLLRSLHGLAGVTYVEPGLPLVEPRPDVAGAPAAPPSSLRRVTAAERHHGHGRGVLVGIVDVGGFDFAHEDFLDESGATRWVAIWDQAGTVRPSPADRDRTGAATGRYAELSYGADIRAEHMAAALAAAPARRMAPTTLEPQSAMARASHGTHVASIAAGNRGVARRAHLAGVLVALRPEDAEASSSFYDTTRIADAVDYLLALAAELGGPAGPLPVAINVSLGTNGHAHDTSSAMARWIDHALTSPGRCVTVAAGNAGQVEPASPEDRSILAGRIHAGGRFTGTGLRHELGWVVGAGGVADVSENELEVWYSPQDRIDVEVRPPGGRWIGPVHPGRKLRNELLPNGTVLSVHSEAYYPANGANRISVLLSPYYGPTEGGVRAIGPVAPGEWRVRLTGTVVRDGRWDAWIERDDPRRVAGPTGREWEYPSAFAPGSYGDDRMISTLACAERLVAVANVDVAANRAHVTSSRGPTRDGRPKPDIGADGTAVPAACGFDRTRPWVRMTGTSMASPYVCGVAALMLAIDPQLTSAQVQGLMRTTSAPLPGHDFAWRSDTGFGLVDAGACVAAAVEHRASREEAEL